MRTITIRFEFPNKYDHEEIESSVDSWIGDFMDTQLSNDISYTIIERS